MSHERARKIEQALFRGLSSVGQSKVAEVLNTSEPTISKMKNENNGEVKVTFPGIAKMIHAMGFKIVPQEYKCVDIKTFEMLHYGHQQWTNSIKNPDQLLWDDE